MSSTMATTVVTHTFDNPVTPGQPEQRGWRRFVHLQWTRQKLGMLKIAEAIVVFLAMCIMGSVSNVVGM